MKKIIFSAAMIAAIAFTGCSKDDEDENTCKTCEEVSFFLFSADVELCDNGDGTAEMTYTIEGVGSETQSIDLDGQSIDDFDCSLLSGFSVE